jgi:hypothetical protein
VKTRASLLAFLVAAATVPGQEPAKILTGVEKTAHFEIRFRPGSRAEASVDRVAVLAEQDLQKILQELALPDFKHVVRLFLYDDVDELQKVTGNSSCAGYSITLESHIPHDNDQTRLHELVHVVAEKLPEKGPEPRNLFFAEGLANAVLRFVTGVHVDAVAAFYKKRGKLPSLAEVHALGDFYDWLRKHPGVNGYDVAGSYMRYLLDTYGPMKTRKYYCGVPAREAFGVDLPAIEKGWHARLDKVVLRPGLEALLAARAGEAPPSDESKLGEAILGPKSEWTSLDGALVRSGDPGKWARDGEAPGLVVSGEKNQGDWSVARLTANPVGDAIVRCRGQMLAGSYGLRVEFGPECQALVLKGQGAFLYNVGAAVSFNNSVAGGDKPVDIVLRRRGGRASIWIDGLLAVEGEVPKGPSTLGFGSVGGQARFTELALRRL